LHRSVLQECVSHGLNRFDSFTKLLGRSSILEPPTIWVDHSTMRALIPVNVELDLDLLDRHRFSPLSRFSQAA
jgi:hypothetical protein